jgi:hypothetical protein
MKMTFGKISAACLALPLLAIAALLILQPG